MREMLYHRALFEPAVLSDDRRYRYTWTRQLVHESWRVPSPEPTGEPRQPCAFIMLNPSTADEARKDPTVTRCQIYAADWGYDHLIVLNLFAYRATEPEDMKAQEDPVGRDNDLWLRRVCEGVLKHGGVIVCAWGTHATHHDRERKVLAGALDGIPLHALKLTKDGHPHHPLYLPKTLRPQPWRGYHKVDKQNGLGG